MKKYIALLLFALITTLSFGQSNSQDVVYLENGSIISGVNIEKVPNNSIKVETADRNIYVYQMAEIEKLTKEHFQEKNSSSLDNSSLQSDYKTIVELGYQIGIGAYGMDRLELNIIYGYQIKLYFLFGFGTGLRYYFDAKAAVLPVFADFRSNFTNNKISPYLSLDVGYSFNLTSNLEGVGLLLNPNVGVSFKVSDKSAMNVGLGYEMQKMDFYYYQYLSSSENSGAISILVGISF